MGIKSWHGKAGPFHPYEWCGSTGLERGEHLAFQRASCRQGSGWSMPLVDGLMKVKFPKLLVQTGQEWGFSPCPCHIPGAAAALAASEEQEPGFDESQPHQGCFSFSTLCCLLQPFRGAKNSSHRQSGQIILMRAQR